ncbi:hypothetical protein GWK47_009450 [Chionoecetes opilio]|uniref:Uncharacterized protein n=1 Tax=Chionoecetes opilio TaxID=41210 RepID=A0A8J5CNL3_CHIOP|nr:hypothetical protein GWK47_009450 [Chionoecetes opilio]
MRGGHRQRAHKRVTISTWCPTGSISSISDPAIPAPHTLPGHFSQCQHRVTPDKGRSDPSWKVVTCLVPPPHNASGVSCQLHDGHHHVLLHFSHASTFTLVVSVGIRQILIEPYTQRGCKTRSFRLFSTTHNNRRGIAQIEAPHRWLLRNVTLQSSQGAVIGGSQLTATPVFGFDLRRSVRQAWCMNRTRR